MGGWPGRPGRVVVVVGVSGEQGRTPMTMGRLLGRLVVTLTTALIFFISYTPQIFIIWPWYGRELSIELLALLVPFKCDICSPISHRGCSIHETFKKAFS
jgi:hypothetical protein